jgi:hypothetical protein
MRLENHTEQLVCSCGAQGVATRIRESATGSKELVCYVTGPFTPRNGTFHCQYCEFGNRKDGRRKGGQRPERDDE